MKPKLFLIRYGDKVLLILLAGILVFAILMAVRSGPEGRQQYGKDLEIASSEVEELLRKPPPPEQSELGAETLAEVVASLENPPVVGVLPTRPLWGSGGIVYTRVDMMVNDTKVVDVPGVQITETVQVPQEIVPLFTYDPDQQVTVLTIKGTRSTSGQSVSLILRDKDKQEHEFPIVVFTEEVVPKPYPPRNVIGQNAIGTVLITAELQQPESIGIARVAERPLALEGGKEVFAQAVGLKVYRKNKDAPLTQYRLLTENAVKAITKTEFDEELRKWGVVEESVVGATTGAGGPMELVPEGGSLGRGVAKEAKLWCIYSDAGVVPDESYDYMVVAAPAGLGNKDSDPCYLRIDVVPDVSFYITNIRSGTISVSITRHIYKELLTLTWRSGDLLPGDPIGTITKNVRATDIKTGAFKMMKDNADLSTGCVLVDVLRNVPKYVPNLTKTWENVPGPAVFIRNPDGTGGHWQAGQIIRVPKWNCTVNVKRDSCALYLDKKGRLEAKYAGLPAPAPKVGTSTLGGAPNMLLPGLRD